jgi:hypothetical protein
MLFHVKRNFEARTLFVKTTPYTVDGALFRLLFFTKQTSQEPMFHVKHVELHSFSAKAQRMEQVLVLQSRLALLPDTELLENRPEDILDVHPTQQPAQGIGGSTQFFGGELLALFYKLQTPAQAVRCPA